MKKILIFILFIVFISTNVYGDSICRGNSESCQNEMIPIETESVTYDTEIINESGNVVYIITNGGDVSGINIGMNDDTESEEEETPIKPQVKYGTASEKWWTGVVIMNPSNEIKSGLLKLNNQYYNVTVTPGAPLTFNLINWVPQGNNQNQYTISLWSNDLYIDVVIDKK